MTSDEQIDAIADALWNKRATRKDELARVLREIGLKELLEAGDAIRRSNHSEWPNCKAWDGAKAKLERETAT